MESLPDYSEIAFGEVASTSSDRARRRAGFQDRSIDGQLGWFYDSDANRDQLAPFVSGKRCARHVQLSRQLGYATAAAGCERGRLRRCIGGAVEAIRARLQRQMDSGDKNRAHQGRCIPAKGTRRLREPSANAST
jgi:hypothetical protein